ncbi:hypothetical protein BESB_072670 [Besnoitia besnoiti]|uniref:Uncharacterized protein n=1 Tax=Besnoitia besnoiti TaxID=94643 RepID=A0A2A9M7Z4_BESBE|nr:uncharacterized protein BESB_072670 [Besnoitia besnoiti]PFH34115.1 hypothetical protein BESB_072670 [Besnoitia besnoiti]
MSPSSSVSLCLPSAGGLAARCSTHSPFAVLGASASLNLHPAVPDYVLSAIRDRMVLEYNQLLPLELVMPVCDSLSGPFCPHLAAPRVTPVNPASPMNATEALQFVAAPLTSPPGAAFPQNPDFYYAYVHRVPVTPSASDSAALHEPPASSSPHALADRSSVAAESPAVDASPLSPSSFLSSLSLSFVSSLWYFLSSADSQDAPSLFAASSGAQLASQAPPASSLYSAPAALVDWRFSFISRDRPGLCCRAQRHHPERPFAPRGEFLENGIGDVSASVGVSEALSSAIGQIGLGRKALDDIWKPTPLGLTPPGAAPPASSRSPLSSLPLFSRAVPPAASSAVAAAAPSEQRFVCFVNKARRAVDRSACAFAAEFSALPPTLRPSQESFARGWIATSHLLTFEKSSAPFARPSLEPNYAAGLPTDAETHWSGYWEVAPVSYEEEYPRDGGRGPGASFSHRPQGTSGSPASLPRSPARFYGKGESLFFQGEGSSPPQRPSGSAGLPLPVRLQPPVALRSLAVLSSVEGSVEHGTSFVASAIWVRVVRNPLASASLQRLLPRVVFVVSGFHDDKEVFSAQIPVAALAESTDLQLPLPPTRAAPLQDPEYAFVNLLDYVPSTATPWSRVESLKFRYALRPPAAPLHAASASPAGDALAGARKARASGAALARIHAAGGPGGATSALEPLMGATLAGLAYKVGLGGMLLHVAQRSNGVRTVYYVDRRSDEGVALLKFFEEKGTLAPAGETAPGKAEDARTLDATEAAIASRKKRRDEAAAERVGDAGANLDILSLLFPQDSEGRRSERARETGRRASEAAGGAVEDSESGEAPPSSLRPSVGSANTEGDDASTSSEEGSDEDALDASEPLTREKVKRAIRSVVLTSLRAALDEKTYTAVAATLPPASGPPKPFRQLQPLKTLLASLPGRFASPEELEESENGTFYAAVLRTHGDGTGEFLWQQAEDTTAAATAIADRERARRSQARRAAEAETRDDAQAGGDARETHAAEAGRADGAGWRGATAGGGGGDNGAGAAVGGDAAENVALTGGLDAQFGTTAGSNRRLPLAKYDSLNNALVDLRLPARSVGLYIQEIPVEAPLFSFNEAAAMKLILWRRVGFDTEGKYRDTTTPARSGNVLADVKTVMSQVLESLGGRPKTTPARGGSAAPSALKKAKGAGRGAEAAPKPDPSLRNVLESFFSLLSTLKNSEDPPPPKTAPQLPAAPVSETSTPLPAAPPKTAEPASRQAATAVGDATPRPSSSDPPSPSSSPPSSQKATQIQSGAASAAGPPGSAGHGKAPSAARAPPRAASAAARPAEEANAIFRELRKALELLGDPQTASETGTGAEPMRQAPANRGREGPAAPESRARDAAAAGSPPTSRSFSLTDFINKKSDAKSGEEEERKAASEETKPNDSPAAEEEKKPKGGDTSHGVADASAPMGFFIDPDGQVTPLGVGREAGAGPLPGVPGLEQVQELFQSVLRDVSIPEMTVNMANQLSGAQMGPENLTLGRVAQAFASQIESREDVSEPTAQLGKFASALASLLETPANSTGASAQSSTSAPRTAPGGGMPSPVAPPADMEKSLAALNRVAQELAAQFVIATNATRAFSAGGGGKEEAPRAKGGNAKEAPAEGGVPRPPAPEVSFAFAVPVAPFPGAADGAAPGVEQLQAAFEQFVHNGSGVPFPLADLFTPPGGPPPPGGAGQAAGGAAGWDNVFPGAADLSGLAQSVFGGAAEVPGGLPGFANVVAGGVETLDLRDLLGQLSQGLGGKLAREDGSPGSNSKAHPKYRQQKHKKKQKTPQEDREQNGDET